jgi:hypothetical protein
LSARPRVVKTQQHAADEAVARRIVLGGRECHVGGVGQEVPDLLQRAQLRFVHVDHHVVMTGP